MNNTNEINDINNIKINNDLKEQEKLKQNLMVKNEKKEKKKIINSKYKNINKFIYKTEEQKSNADTDINKETKNKVKNAIITKPIKEYQIRRESDIAYDIKPNYNTNISFSKNNKIKREVSLDISNSSPEKKSSSKKTPKKQAQYEMSNVNDFTIRKSALLNDEKNNEENKFYKKNNIITNININNFSDKKEIVNKMKTNKNIKSNKSNDKKKKRDKDKSKPKFNFQIDLKDLINEKIKEISKISPDKRYADIEMKRRTKNKKIGEDKYYKPFKFNINDDY